MKIDKDYIKYIMAPMFLTLAYSVYYPFLSVFLKTEINMNEADIGLVISLSIISGATVLPFMGMLADKLKKSLLINSILLFISGILLFVLGNAHSAMLASISYIAYNSFSRPSNGLLASNVSKYCHKNNKDYGRLQSYNYFIAMFVPLIMGWIMYVTNNRRIMFYMASALFFVNAVHVFFLPKQEDEHVQESHLKEELKKLLKNKLYVILAPGMAILMAVISSATIYTALLINSLNGNDSTVGLQSTLISVVSLFVMILSPKIKSKVKNLLVIIVFSIVFLLIKNILFAGTQNVSVVIAGALLHGLAFGLIQIVDFPLITKIVDKNVLHTANTAYFSLFSYVNALIVFLSGLIVQAYSINAVYVFHAVVGAIPIIFLVVCFPLMKKHNIINKA